MSSSPHRSSRYRRKTAKYVLSAIGLGLLPMLLLLVLISGSFNNAFTLLGVSIICTLGIGGLFWLGVSFLLGSIVLELFLPGVGCEVDDGDPQPASPQARDRVRVEPLARFSLQALQQGSTDASLRRDLHRAGWEFEIIDAAIATARSRLADTVNSGAGSGADAP